MTQVNGKMQNYTRKYEELQRSRDPEKARPVESHPLSDYLSSKPSEMTPLKENETEEEGPHISSDPWTWLPAVLAELVGTMLFVAVGCASVSLGGAAAGMAHGLAIAVMVACFGSISGGHFNPVVSFAVALSGELNWKIFYVYVIAQFLGGIIGASITRGFMGNDAYEQINGGAHMLGNDVLAIAGILCEIAITWILVQSVLLTAVDPRSKTPLAPLIIGVSVAVGILAGVGTTGGSMNPARTLGAAVPASGMLESDTVERIWEDFYIYLVGPILGALLATAFYKLVFATPSKRAIGKDT